MDIFMIDNCSFCKFRNGLICTQTKQDCQPGVKPCPFRDKLGIDCFPCKYSCNDNVARFLEFQDIAFQKITIDPKPVETQK